MVRALKTRWAWNLVTKQSEILAAFPYKGGECWVRIGYKR